MEKKKIPLPDFKTIEEMAEFFDKTDTTLLEGFEEVDIKFVKAEDNTPGRSDRKQKRSVPHP
jgi:molybdopterin-guanine dinucleotide biosynthesis protein